jgi:dihydropteroate synthase
MGVLNVTPDSFSDGGSLHKNGRPDLSKALVRVEQMLFEGAAIIDVGGESTRPGAEAVSVMEEMERVLPVVDAINARFDTIISVDTSSPELMLAAAKSGAGMLNDVRALEREGAIIAAAQTGLPVCLMHMQGRPKTMQQAPRYDSVVAEVAGYLKGRVESCQQGGIDSSQILLDPGFGFGKSLEHNLTLLNRLEGIVELGLPVLVGLSRKSLIGKVLGRDVNQRLAGSLTLAVLAAERGASIIRVHDVAETVDAMVLLSAVEKEKI